MRIRDYCSGAGNPYFQQKLFATPIIFYFDASFSEAKIADYDDLFEET